MVGALLSLMMYPMNPMTKKPTPTAWLIFMNSRRSGFVHRLMNSVPSRINSRGTSNMVFTCSDIPTVIISAGRSTFWWVVRFSCKYPTNQPTNHQPPTTHRNPCLWASNKKVGKNIIWVLVTYRPGRPAVLNNTCLIRLTSIYMATKNRAVIL